MLKDFKSFVFVSVDVKGVAGAFFVSVDVKGLTSRERSLDSRCSLGTTISGFRSPVDSTGVQRPHLVGWSLSEKKRSEVGSWRSDAEDPPEEMHESLGVGWKLLAVTLSFLFAVPTAVFPAAPDLGESGDSLAGPWRL